jgi:hypothetical protein
MKSFEKDKGKIFVQFASFACRKHPAAAVFSGSLPAAAVLIAALFFTSCGGANDSLLENENTPPPPAKPDPELSIDLDKSTVQGGTISIVPFTVKLNGELVTPYSVKVSRSSGEKSNGTFISINQDDTNYWNLTVADKEPTGFLTITATKDDKDAAAELAVTIPEDELNISMANTYNIPDDEAWIFFYEGSETDVVIPSEIGGKPVTTIAPHAFEYWDDKGIKNQLKSVTIPDSVVTIKYKAFKNNLLESVVIPDSVVSLGEYENTGWWGEVFMDNKNLKSVTLPNSLTTIEKSTFQNTGLTSVDIPNSVTTIGESAFQKTTALKSIVIPNSVTSIGQSAFQASGLESISIPDSVTSIGERAFMNAASLKSIVIPNSVETIGKMAFQGSALTDVSLGAKVETIGESAFRNTALKSVSIPDSVTSIEKQAFDIASLTSVSIGANVINFGDKAFGADPKTSDFKTAYNTGGVGTYKYDTDDKTWTKQ